ncbi:MAG TPA: gamma-glutamylcyclotransferase [Alphaproteobacteria bacterium]
MMTVGEHAPEENGCPPPSDGRDIWIFAYGSLMWDPGFPFEEARPALLKGYHRSLCIYSTRYRGTPERPGLVLGLDRGGACRGIAYRVAAANVDRVMAYLWDREMVTRAYSCRNVTIHLETGAVTARTFVVNRRHPQYAGKLTDTQLVELVCQGHGQRGPCRSYLENTVRHLDQLGVPDRRLHELLQHVRARSA